MNGAQLSERHIVTRPLACLAAALLALSLLPLAQAKPLYVASRESLPVASARLENAVLSRDVTFFSKCADPETGRTPISAEWGWDLFARPDDIRLAQAALILSAAAEDSAELCEAEFSAFGFEHIQSLHYDRPWYLPETPAVTFASRKINLGDGERWVFAVCVRGTTDLADVFTDALSLVNDWDDATEAIAAEASDYILSVKGTPADTKDILFLTGHSLGGAVANNLSALLSPVGSLLYTYTFASPYTQYTPLPLPHVYNFICTKDIVTHVPPGLLYRAGRDVTLGEDFDPAAEEIFSALTGGKGLTSSDAPSLAALGRLLTTHDCANYYAYLKRLWRFEPHDPLPAAPKDHKNPAAMPEFGGLKPMRPRRRPGGKM